MINTIELALPSPNSRQGYPTLTNGVEELHDEPQFEGHVFLPGFTVDTKILRSPFGYPPIEGDYSVDNFLHNVCWLDGRWLVPEYFSRHAGYCAALLAAALQDSRSEGVGVYRFAVDQFEPGYASMPHGVGWHHDYPSSPHSWQYTVANRDTTEIVLIETKADDIGNAVDRGAPIWRARSGEVVLIDRYTGHRRPRIRRASTYRTFASLDPAIVHREDMLVLPTEAALAAADYGDYEDVAIATLPQSR